MDEEQVLGSCYLWLYEVVGIQNAALNEPLTDKSIFFNWKDMLADVRLDPVRVCKDNSIPCQGYFLFPLWGYSDALCPTLYESGPHTRSLSGPDGFPR